MLAFNDASDIIWYWDEPTITLDYESHPFHEILQKNWKQNEILMWFYLLPHYPIKKILCQ